MNQEFGNAARLRRQIPLRRSQFATNGEIRRDSQVVAVDLRGKNFASSGSFTETAALSFSDGASPIRRESTRSKRKPRLPAACATICALNLRYSKQRDETEATEKAGSRLRVCLCNHISKNGCRDRVRSGSLVACADVFSNCVGATEGASRGRPLGGSLKSLALKRECPKARSD